MHINDNKKDIILGESPTQVLYDTATTAEVKCFINFSRSQWKYVLGLHYKESNGFSFVYVTKMYQFKAKKSETKPYPLCLRNILEHCLANSMKKQY